MRNEGQGKPGADGGLFSLAVEGRVPGFRVVRVAVVRGENWPSKSLHYFAFSLLRQRKVAGLQIPKTPGKSGLVVAGRNAVGWLRDHQMDGSG